MFNRGVQFIRESELVADLNTLDPNPPVENRAPNRAEQVIERFFFIHEASARRFDEPMQRSYEFTNATMGEYLAARYLVQLLAQPDGGGGVSGDGELLAVLLSYRILPQRLMILEFLKESFSALREGDRSNISRLLEAMIEMSRFEPEAERYKRYRPVSADPVRKAAVRSLNLVILRLLCGSAFDISSLTPKDWDAGQWWSSTVRLWSAGLTFDEWAAAAAILTLREGKVGLVELDSCKELETVLDLEVATANLRGDVETARALQKGITALAREL